jgi:hypothetical protein
LVSILKGRSCNCGSFKARCQSDAVWVSIASLLDSGVHSLHPLYLMP